MGKGQPLIFVLVNIFLMSELIYYQNYAWNLGQN